MLAFPNAKINLGLDILRKRSDGYHDISSCLYPVPWHDVLEIIPADDFGFEQTGLEIPGEKSSNLCIKAYHLLKADFDLNPVAIHLHKVIPMGAGLGGGSSDGAFTLKILNRIFDLQLSADQLKAYAGKLGSDCPFFIDNIPAIASGRGTDLSPVDLDLSDFYVGLKKPDVHVSTKEAYAGVRPNHKAKPLSERLSGNIKRWENTIVNDFERSIFPSYPQISLIKEEMYERGAVYSAMSGSGSCVFGLFESMPHDEKFFDLLKPVSIHT